MDILYETFFIENIDNYRERHLPPQYNEPIIKNIRLIPIEQKEKEQNEIKYTNGAVFYINENTLKLPNGEIFKGLMEEHCLVKGIYTWPNGQKYEGTFNENNTFQTELNLRNSITFSNKDVYVCEFSNGMMNGSCSLIFNNGKKIEGDFVNGNISGNLKVEDPNNNYEFNGAYSNFQINGDFYLKKKINNKIYEIEGCIINNKKEGPFEAKELDNEENFYFSGEYKNDIRNGIFTIIDKEANIIKENEEFSVTINFKKTIKRTKQNVNKLIDDIKNGKFNYKQKDKKNYSNTK